jgi:ankyrin repeat protein
MLDGSGLSALHHAVVRGHVECVRLLLDAGADPDLQTGAGEANRPLHLAAQVLHPTTALLSLSLRLLPILTVTASLQQVVASTSNTNLDTTRTSSGKWYTTSYFPLTPLPPPSFPHAR